LGEETAMLFVAAVAFSGVPGHLQEWPSWSSLFFGLALVEQMRLIWSPTSFEMPIGIGDVGTEDNSIKEIVEIACVLDFRKPCLD
jgi:hypothetical protein